MEPSMRRRALARPVVLLAVAALALHHLRYLAGHGAGAGEALARNGHGYLSHAVPALLTVAALTVVTALLAAAAGRRAGPAPRLTVPVAAVLLLGVFVCQEVVEGLVAGGQPSAGLLLAHGGWVAVPLAPLLGLATAYALRSLDSIESRLADAPPARRIRGAAAFAHPLRVPERPARRARRPLAFGLARRPPPAAATG